MDWITRLDHTGNVEVTRLREAINRLLTCGNHIALYKTDKWPDYPLDGSNRDQQCERALHFLGAGREYDMWCCWSGMMLERDALQREINNPLKRRR